MSIEVIEADRDNEDAYAFVSQLNIPKHVKYIYCSCEWNDHCPNQSAQQHARGNRCLIPVK
jgi:hypothetical protein